MAEQTVYKSKPSWKVIIIWIFSKLLLQMLIYGLFGYFIISRLEFEWFNSYVLLTIIGLVAIIFLYLIFLWKTYDYKVTNKGIYFKGGIIVKKQKFVPFFKVTNVEASQNIVEQILGINKIGFQTAGTGGQPKPEIVFEGLEDVEKPKKLVSFSL